MILKLSDCSALWGAAPLRRTAGLAKHGCRRLLEGEGEGEANTSGPKIWSGGVGRVGGVSTVM